MQEAPPLTVANVETALQCLTGAAGGYNVDSIKQAERALLSWQNCEVNAYAQTLLYATLNPRIRLAALLSLKAAVKAFWRDRGRRVGRGQTHELLDESTKRQVKSVLLSIVTTGQNPILQQGTIELQEHSRNQYSVESVILDRTVQAAATSCLVQVALYDLPKQSLDLIPILISHVLLSESMQISSVVMVQKRNAMYALEAILHDLSEKRLLGMKQCMQTVAVNHIAGLIQYGSCLVNVFSTLDSTMSELCILLVRTVHYLLQSSLPTLLETSSASSTNAASVDQCMKLILDFSTTALLSEGSFGTNPQLLHLCESLWTLVVRVQGSHRIAFGRYLEAFLHMYYNVILLGIDGTMSSASNVRTFLAYYERRISESSSLCKVPDELMILALQFVANVASCSEYARDEATNAAIPILQNELSGTGTKITSKGDMNLRTSDVQQAVHAVWDSFFTHERISKLGDACACHLMSTSPWTIEEWAADPEDFFLSEEHRAAEDSVSSAADMLFCSLVESSVARPAILGRLVALVADAELQVNAFRCEIASRSPTDIEFFNSNVNPSVILWEAIYKAAGLSAASLDDFAGWDFSVWYQTTLDPCLRLLLSSSGSAQAVPLLRRRVIWLIGCNTSRLPSDSSAIKYMSEIIATRRSAHNDVAVKLSAVQVMSAMVANFDEASEQCIPRADFIISSLYRLANECKELESQSSVLDVIPLILSYIIGTGREVTVEVANASVIPIPSIWDASIGESALLRRNLISILVTIVPAIGSASVESLYPIGIPIIAKSLDHNDRNENSVLIDETLLLWLAILRFSDAYHTSLRPLFPLAVGLLDNDLEHLRLAMMITEAYIMLGRQEFLASNADCLCKALHLTITKVRPRGAKYIGLVLEALLREYPGDGGLLLLRSNVLETMLRSCALNQANDKLSEPDRVIAIYLCSLSRILFASPKLLDGLLPLDIGSGLSFDHKELLQLYLRMMGLEMDAFSKCLWMKLLCSLFPVQPPRPLPPESKLSMAFATVMDEFLHCCVRVVPEVRSERISQYYQLEYDSDEEAIETGHERYEAMPRHSTTSMDPLGSTLQNLASLCKSLGGRRDAELLGALLGS